MTHLEMFEWPKYTENQFPSSGKLQIEIHPTDRDDEWLLVDRDKYNQYASRSVAVSEDGTFLGYRGLPDVFFIPNLLKFTDSPEALDNAGVTVKFDQGEYSRYLEPEAWGRAIIGYPLLAFMGKAAGRIIDGDYWHRRLHCYPPRAKISVRSPDGSYLTTLYELPTPTKKLNSDDIGAMVSADGRFLYIYIQKWGSLLPLNQEE